MVPSSLFLTCGLDMSFTVLFSQSPGPLCEGKKKLFRISSLSASHEIGKVIDCSVPSVNNFWTILTTL